MSARQKHTVSTARTTLFRLADAADAAVTGAVNGDFTKQVYKDAATDVLTITVTEVANGWYKAVYTPASNGYWMAHVSHATYNVAGWSDEIDVVTSVIETLLDAMTELSSGAPSATPTPVQALMLLYMALRNKGTTTATLQKIFNDAGSAICKATLSDDGTTFTREEFVAP